MSTFETNPYRDNSLMLGRIGNLVEDFCDNHDTTTEQAVKNLLIEFYEMKADLLYMKAEKLKKPLT